jgi:hypothetical protein
LRKGGIIEKILFQTERDTKSPIIAEECRRKPDPYVARPGRDTDGEPDRVRSWLNGPIFYRIAGASEHLNQQELANRRNSWMQAYQHHDHSRGIWLFEQTIVRKTSEGGLWARILWAYFLFFTNLWTGTSPFLQSFFEAIPGDSPITYSNDGCFDAFMQPFIGLPLLSNLYPFVPIAKWIFSNAFIIGCSLHSVQASFVCFIEGPVPGLRKRRRQRCWKFTCVASNSRTTFATCCILVALKCCEFMNIYHSKCSK